MTRTGVNVRSMADVEARVDRLIADHLDGPPRDFWGAQFDLGLAWIHFPEGKGGLGLDPGLAFERRFNLVDRLRSNLRERELSDVAEQSCSERGGVARLARRDGYLSGSTGAKHRCTPVPFVVEGSSAARSIEYSGGEHGHVGLPHAEEGDGALDTVDSA